MPLHELIDYMIACRIELGFMGVFAAIIVAVFGGFCYSEAEGPDSKLPESEKEVWRRYAKWSAAITILIVLGIIFTPNRRDLEHHLPTLYKRLMSLEWSDLDLTNTPVAFIVIPALVNFGVLTYLLKKK